MQTESISTNQENVETKVTDPRKSFNLRFDGNLGMQLALISGLSGRLYYFFSVLALPEYKNTAIVSHTL